MKKEYDTFELITDEFARNIGVTTNQLQFITEHKIKGRSAEMIDKEYYHSP